MKELLLGCVCFVPLVVAVLVLGDIGVKDGIRQLKQKEKSRR